MWQLSVKPRSDTKTFFPADNSLYCRQSACIGLLQHDPAKPPNTTKKRNAKGRHTKHLICSQNLTVCKAGILDVLWFKMVLKTKYVSKYIPFRKLGEKTYQFFPHNNISAGCRASFSCSASSETHYEPCTVGRQDIYTPFYLPTIGGRERK